MRFNDLQAFIRELEARGQLKRVAAKVDPILEISAIADRVSRLPAAGTAPPPPTDPVHGRQGGWGLLFENVQGSDIPVAINIFGSYERMRLALGVESFDELADRVQQLVKPEMPTTLLEKMKKLPQLARIAGFGPKVVKRGICQEVVHTDDANLLSLPIIQCWPHDGEPGYGGKPPIQSRDREGAGGESHEATPIASGQAPPRSHEAQPPLAPPLGKGGTGGSAPAATSPSPASTPKTPKPATATWACTASRSTARSSPPCTGTCTTTARGTSEHTKNVARRCR
mgnify:CR=1 FL=1